MKKCFFFFFFFYLSGCNYNYYLGKKLEKDQRFQEASIEYSRAYFTKPSNKKYQESYKRNAKKSAQILQENYKEQIQNNAFSSAYKILEQAILLDSENEFFKKEQTKWQFVLLTGKVEYPKKKDISGLIIGDKIFPVIQFRSPQEEKKLEATLEVDGAFYLENLLYYTKDESYLDYTIHTIGFNYLPFQTNSAEQNDFAYLEIINFYQPQLLNYQGAFRENNKLNFSQKILSKEFEVPRKDITYSAKIENNIVYIQSSNHKINFLPLALYKNKNRIILDFGTIKLRKKDSFVWEVAQEKNNSLLKEFITKNFYYKVYQKTLNNPYFFVQN